MLIEDPILTVQPLGNTRVILVTQKCIFLADSTDQVFFSSLFPLPNHTLTFVTTHFTQEKLELLTTISSPRRMNFTEQTFVVSQADQYAIVTQANEQEVFYFLLQRPFDQVPSAIIHKVPFFPS